MKIAILGTGSVGRTLAEKLAELGHDVTIGTREVAATLSRTEPDRMGTPPFQVWQDKHTNVLLARYIDAANGADIVMNASNGAASLDILAAVGAVHLDGKVLVDVANPLDFSRGFPALNPVNTDSLGEQIQRAFPNARVVKTLNTMTAAVMVNPAMLAGETTVFVAGDDAEAKQTVRDLLQSFGWPTGSIVDLGGIDGARASEAWLLLWIRLMGPMKGPFFNLKLVQT
jgi:8-hydroxy-5-deazaflavin:NADPH oxidoreductase